MKYNWISFSILIFAFFLFVFQVLAQDLPSIGDKKIALEQAIKSKDLQKAARLAYELGRDFEATGDDNKRYELYIQSLNYAKKSNNVQISYLSNRKLASIFSNRKDFGESISYLENALKYAKELRSQDYISETLIEIGKDNSYSLKYKRAIAAVEEALTIATEQGNISRQQECYQLLTTYYGKLNNNVKAKAYLNLYQQMVDSRQKEIQREGELKQLQQKVEIVDKEKKTVVEELTQKSSRLEEAKDSLQFTKSSLLTAEQTLLEEKQVSEKRKLEIDLLNKDKELADFKFKEQEARLEYETWIKNLTVGGIILAVILVIVVVINYRRQVKAKRRIEEQNKSIKSSINYAKRIQEAMLPKPELRDSLLPDSFVLFKPRDSVSGDFYWISEIKNWYSPDVVFAAVDCTGHGVPGAFMSMIGVNALNGIIARGIAETNEILEALDQEIRSTLQQDKSENRDGMDIALCIYRKEKNTIEFSGAKNPCIYIQNNELQQIKGDVHSIGGTSHKKKAAFKKHQIVVDVPTVVYLFSDGYRDQFGGKENTKFMSKRFSNLLHEIHMLPLNEQMEILNKRIEDWKNGSHQTDDILVMGIKIDPVNI